MFLRHFCLTFANGIYWQRLTGKRLLHVACIVSIRKKYLELYAGPLIRCYSKAIEIKLRTIINTTTKPGEIPANRVLYPADFTFTHLPPLPFVRNTMFAKKSWPVLSFQFPFRGTLTASVHPWRPETSEIYRLRVFRTNLQLLFCLPLLFMSWNFEISACFRRAEV